MSVYGISITPEVTGKEIEITSGSRAMSYLGYYKTEVSNNNYITVTVPNKTPGSTLYIVPVNMGTLVLGGTSSVTSAIIVDNININGNVITLHINEYYRFIYPRFAVFEVLGAGNTADSYGIALADSTNYLEITDSSKMGCCVWVGNVTINGTWSVPTSIPARQNSVVFVNWSSADAALIFDDTTKTISCYQNDSLTTVNASIAVFTSGFNLELPDYGLAIWNANGQCTFSSKYAPLIASGIVSLNATPGTWVTCPVSRPMIPVGVVGATKTWSGGGRAKWSECGIKMSGNRVTGGAARYMNNVADSNMNRSLVSPVSFPVLDCNNYF
ncbi:DUF6453 family protein [Pragia fontium]|uniref:DUF6453 family protein n=1 Tax=Pragia fontium TaxID=82985 RepID=UPI000F6E8D28|nr:DUF6453 family protein [Pragia fontium]VEJ54656.1 Uncharacterised protein [Pragia fontium]